MINRRYKHGSIILTTNRGIADWGEIFEDTTVATAILGRLLHHATVLTIAGDSYRVRAATRRVEDGSGRSQRWLEGWGILILESGEFPFPLTPTRSSTASPPAASGSATQVTRGGRPLGRAAHEKQCIVLLP